MENHRKSLESLCRLCTKKLGRVSYSTNTPAEKGSNITLLQQCFECQITENADIYPPRFCNSCSLTLKRIKKSQHDGTVYRTSLTLHSWTAHTEENCVTCEMVEARKTGGRPKIKKNIQGCPSALSTHIRSVAGPRYRCSIPVTPNRVLATSGVAISDLTCTACDCVVDEPVELACKHLVCYSCCLKILRTNLHSFPCPHCQHHHQLETSTFQPPAPLVDKLLQKVVVKCDMEQCSQATHLPDLKAHIDSKCTQKISTISHDITVDHIL